MITQLFTNAPAFFITLLGLLIAVTVHEFSHAFIADRLGDPTARLMGRVTLNPFAHLDPWGTAAILLVGFGWGKPVPFDPFNLANPRRDSALISVAGPASNILLAIILAIIYHSTSPAISAVLEPLIYINVMLALFNLIPVGPLDGFKIVAGLLPDNYVAQWEETERLGMLLLVALLLPLTPRGSLVTVILSPLLDFILKLLIR